MNEIKNIYITIILVTKTSKTVRAVLGCFDLKIYYFANKVE